MEHQLTRPNWTANFEQAAPGSQGVGMCKNGATTTGGRTMPQLPHALMVAGSILAASAASAQEVKRPPDKPPISQAWIDVATFASPGMHGMGGMMGGMMGGGGGRDMPLSAMMGGKSGDAQFGQTQSGGGDGSYVDVTLRTSRNPNLAEAVQAVPEVSKLAPTLQLKVLPQAKPVREVGEDTVEEAPEQPKARIKLYWGCGPAVRAGQPKVVDFSTGTVGQLADIFKGRRATQRGAHSAPGRPVWPNLVDKRRVPDGASLIGAHTFTGQGVPDTFKFNLPPAQDIMSPIALKQAQVDGVTQLSWQALPTARAYFIAAMGGRGDAAGTAEMTIWTSSELPDSGFGLIDYQTNKSVDQWLKEKVLLSPTTTRCDVPKGIFEEGSGGMLRMIAYGSELNMAYPPRPTDPKIAWEPDWSLKVRVKSVAMSMLGMQGMGDAAGMDDATMDDATAPSDAPADAPADQPKKKKKFSLKDAIDIAKDAIP